MTHQPGVYVPLRALFLVSFEAILFLEPCLFSRKSRNMYFSLNQTRLSNGQAYKERIIYAQNFKESKLPKGLSAMVSYVKKT